MQLRQRRSNVQNIIPVFPDEETTSNVYLPIQVDKGCAVEYVQQTYRAASRIIFTPDSFLTVLGALCKKKLNALNFIAFS
jgi:hypothetical protein